MAEVWETKMTLQEYKAKWSDEISNWSVKNLKADDEFMADCFNYPEFAAYILSARPEMATHRPDKQPKIKFLGLGGTSAGSTEKTPQIEPESVEEISKTGQIMKDLKEYKKNQGFI
jgi:L-asparaginase/Glu-tRNA(Gln) amidotransferase subunit D